MTKKQPLFFLLDFIGAMMIAVGIAEKFAQVNWVPQAYRFEHFELALIFAGFALTLPMLVWVIHRQLVRNKDPK